MTIPMLAVLCLLGNWQMERLEWKLDLIHKIEQRFGLPAIDIPDIISTPDDWLYRHVNVSGRFLHMREMPLYSVGPGGRPGYDLFTPLLMQNGKYVIINRGWVPEEMKEQVTRPQTIKSDLVQVTGVLRKSWQRQRFAPENDMVQNLWYYGDLKAMIKTQGLKNVFPMFLYADKTSEQSKYPVGGRTRLNIVNNHLDYAMTWYGLAIVLLIIYIIFNLRKVHKTEDHF